MNTCEMRAIMMTAILALGVGAALTMPNDEHRSVRRQLAVELDESRRACTSLPDRSIRLCRAEALRTYAVASARIEALYNPSAEAGYKARIAIANAEYLMARRTCDEKTGAVKRACLAYARVAQVAAKAGAHASEDVSVGTRVLDERVSAARRAMREEGERTEARNDAEADRRNTELQISLDACAALRVSEQPACRHESARRFGPL